MARRIKQEKAQDRKFRKQETKHKGKIKAIQRQGINGKQRDQNEE
jgi:hypothetical protein